MARANKPNPLTRMRLLINLGASFFSADIFLRLKQPKHERLPNDYQEKKLRQRRKKADPKIGLSA
jgi:hypothetical protein